MQVFAPRNIYIDRWICLGNLRRRMMVMENTTVSGHATPLTLGLTERQAQEGWHVEVKHTLIGPDHSPKGLATLLHASTTTIID